VTRTFHFLSGGSEEVRWGLPPTLSRNAAPPVARAAACGSDGSFLVRSEGKCIGVQENELFGRITDGAIY
jgi:hypothetical protein